VLRTGTQGIARQASLIPGLYDGSLSGYCGPKQPRGKSFVIRHSSFIIPAWPRQS